MYSRVNGWRLVSSVTQHITQYGNKSKQSNHQVFKREYLRQRMELAFGYSVPWSLFVTKRISQQIQILSYVDPITLNDIYFGNCSNYRFLVSFSCEKHQAGYKVYILYLDLIQLSCVRFHEILSLTHAAPSFVFSLSLYPHTLYFTLCSASAIQSHCNLLSLIVTLMNNRLYNVRKVVHVISDNLGRWKTCYLSILHRHLIPWQRKNKADTKYGTYF